MQALKINENLLGLNRNTLIFRLAIVLSLCSTTAVGQNSLAMVGFGMGQKVNQNMAMQGAQQQAMQQALFEAAQAQFQGFKGHPAAGIGYVNSALGNTPNVGTVNTQETKQNGIFDYLTAMSNSYTGG